VDQASQRRDELTYLWSQGAEGLDRFYRDHAGQVLGWAISLSGPRIDPEDVGLFSFAETAEEAWHAITSWYEKHGPPVMNPITR